MSEWTKKDLPDGRTEGTGRLSINGITVNITYHRPPCTEEELETASRRFRDSFDRLVSNDRKDRFHIL